MRHERLEFVAKEQSRTNIPVLNEPEVSIGAIDKDVQEFSMVDSASRSPVRCREIDVADIDRLVDLLTNGFYPSRRDDWVQRLQRLSENPTPSGFPKYGYLLEYKDTLVGVSLAIYSSIVVNGRTTIRCNVSSWYVKPEFRSYASMLISHGREHKNVTYCNVTPDRHTLPILEAKGYVRYCNGQFLALPALSFGSSDARVKLVATDQPPDENLPPAEMELLSTHAGYGCISVTCTSAGRTYPFVFVPRQKLGFIPFVRLIYCRDVAEFVRSAQPLGRFLAKRHLLLAILDANGPIRGLVGRYFGGHPKYFKGPDQPRLGDLAYSELAMFPRLSESTPGEILAKKLSAFGYRWQNRRNRMTAAAVRTINHMQKS
jgi:hypothetical protein